MPNESTALVTAPPFVKASTQLSAFLGIETGMMIDTLKAQCFKGKKPDEVTDEQLAAFISVCNVTGLNPLLTGMIYCYPERNGGITPIVGPDGTMKKIDEFISSGKLNGYDVTLYPEDPAVKPTHAIATIYRKDAPDHPAKYTAYFSEWVVTSNPNWVSKPRHMLWIRALKQAARQVIHGLPMDDDEYKLGQMLNVTPGTPEGQPEVKKDRPKVERSKKGAAAAIEADSKQEPAIDVTATTPAEKPTAVVAPPVSAPVADHPEPAGVVTTLKDAEVREFKGCKIVSVIADNFGNATKPRLAVKAEVDGPFKGAVFHQDAAFWKDANDQSKGCDADVAWQVGGMVNLALYGRAYPNPGPKAGQVAVLVKSIEVVAVQAESELP